MRRVVIGCLAFIVIYFGVVKLQIFLAQRSARTPEQAVSETGEKPEHKVHVFSFSKYTPSGEKEIEIEGDSANILERVVLLWNVMAKAYAEEVAITLTSDEGQYDKDANEVILKKNVVGTTGNGTRLLTEELMIYPTEKKMDTKFETEVKKDNINIEGMGASGDTHLKKVKFKKNVMVVIQDPEDQAASPTTITCDGPLIIDYEKNIAHFKNHVAAEDTRGILKADLMDVYYNKVSRRVSKIVAMDNVVIENPDGNKTYSDTAIYLADEGRVILGGDTETLYYEGGDRLGEEIFI